MNTNRIDKTNDRDSSNATVVFLLYSMLMTFSFRMFYEPYGQSRIENHFRNKYYHLGKSPTILWVLKACIIWFSRITSIQLLVTGLITCYLAPLIVDVLPPDIAADRSIFGFFVPLSLGIFTMTFSIFSLSINCLKDKTPYALKVIRQHSFFTITQILLVMVTVGSSVMFLLHDQIQDAVVRYIFIVITLILMFAVGLSIRCWASVINAARYEIPILSAIDKIIIGATLNKRYTSHDSINPLVLKLSQAHLDYLRSEIVSNSVEGSSANVRFILDAILGYIYHSASKHHYFWYKTKDNFKLNPPLPLLSIEIQYVSIYEELLKNASIESFSIFFDHVCEVMSLRLRLNSAKSKLFVYDFVSAITNILSSDLIIILHGVSVLPKAQYTINTLMLVLNDY